MSRNYIGRDVLSKGNGSLRVTLKQRIEMVLCVMCETFCRLEAEPYEPRLGGTLRCNVSIALKLDIFDAVATTYEIKAAL